MIRLDVELVRVLPLRDLDRIDGTLEPGADPILDGVTIRGALDIGPVFDERPGAPPDPRHVVEVSGRTATTGPDGRASVEFDGAVLANAFTKPQLQGAKRVLRMAAVPSLHLRSTGVSQRMTHPVVLFDGATYPFEVTLDPGMVIVGHSTDRTQRVWVRLAAPVPSTHRCTIEARSQSGSFHTVDVDLDRHRTIGTADLVRLEPGKFHRFAVLLRPLDPADPAYGIATGTFTTVVPEATGTGFVFGSCHDPHHRDAGHDELNAAWHRLMVSTNERLLLLGDQTYADSLPRRFADTPWDTEGLTKQRVSQRGIDQDDLEAAYRATYLESWNHPTVREVLASQPTYMVMDDHDVVDDFGVIEPDVTFPDPGPKQDEFLIPGGPTRVDAALEVARTHQQSHGPSGWDGVPWSHFRAGPAAYFLANLRVGRSTNVESPPLRRIREQERSTHLQAFDGPTARALGSSVFSTPLNGFVSALDVADWSPILGMDQWNDLLSWARSAEVQDADIVVFGSPLPLAWLPVERIDGKVKEIVEDKAGFIDNLVGAGLGLLLLGPVGIPLGALAAEGLTSVAGGFIGDAVEGAVFSAARNNPDIEDQWEYRANRIDLSRVLTLLFDLANGIDIDTGEQVREPKVVVVVAGDTHMGAVHALVSDRSAHRRNRMIPQVTSSPLSYTPYVDKVYADLVLWGEATIDAMLEERKHDSAGNPIAKSDPADKAGGETSEFALGWPGSSYAAKAYTVVPDRNHGRIEIKRTSNRVRNFRLDFELASTSKTETGFVPYEFEDDPFGGVHGTPVDPGNVVVANNTDTSSPTAPDPGPGVVVAGQPVTGTGTIAQPSTDPPPSGALAIHHAGGTFDITIDPDVHRPQRPTS